MRKNITFILLFASLVTMVIFNLKSITHYFQLLTAIDSTPRPDLEVFEAQQSREKFNTKSPELQVKRLAPTVHQNENPDRLVSNTPNQVAPIEESFCIENVLSEAESTLALYTKQMINPDDAKQMIKYYVDTCSRDQLQSLFLSSSDNNENPVSKIKLLQQLFESATNKTWIIETINNMDISPEIMPEVIESLADASPGLKAALLPALMKNDDIDNFKHLTSTDFMFSSVSNTHLEHYSSSDLKQLTLNMILSASSRYLVPDGKIQQYVINNYQTPETLTFFAKLSVN